MEKLGKILIADDEELLAAVAGGFAKKCLSRDATIVHNGEDLVNELKNNYSQYDLVLTDCDMVEGGITGLDVAKICFERKDYPPVVIISGRSNEIREEAKRYDVEVIDKPYRAEDFREISLRALEKKL